MNLHLPSRLEANYGPEVPGVIPLENRFRYFIQRHEGKLDPKLSMLEQMTNPNKRLPPPPRPSHPLCPERVTFDIHLGTYLGMLARLHHTAAALFEIVPAWLRFLGRLQLPPTRPRRHAEQMDAFADYLRRERGHSPGTIDTYCPAVEAFLD